MKDSWVRAFFSQVSPDSPEEATFQKLVKMVSGINGWQGVEPEKTAGVWRFDSEKAKNAEPPYHAEGVLGLGENEDGTSAPVSQTTTRTSTDSSTK